MPDHAVPLVDHPEGKRAAEPLPAEVDLLCLFLLWMEGVAVVMGVVFWTSFALTRSPFSLGLAIIFSGCWPIIRYGRRLAERGRPGAGLILFSTLPSMGVFQRKFSVSLQVIGGSACNATPFQVGPRHCGQYFRASSAMSRAENIITNSTAAIVVIMRRFIEIYSSSIFLV